MIGCWARNKADIIWNHNAFRSSKMQMEKKVRVNMKYSFVSYLLTACATPHLIASHSITTDQHGSNFEPQCAKLVFRKSISLLLRNPSPQPTFHSDLNHIYQTSFRKNASKNNWKVQWIALAHIHSHFVQRFAEKSFIFTHLFVNRNADELCAYFLWRAFLLVYSCSIDGGIIDNRWVALCTKSKCFLRSAYYWNSPSSMWGMFIHPSTYPPIYLIGCNDTL